MSTTIINQLKAKLMRAYVATEYSLEIKTPSAKRFGEEEIKTVRKEIINLLNLTSKEIETLKALL